MNDTNLLRLVAALCLGAGAALSDWVLVGAGLYLGLASLQGKAVVFTLLNIPLSIGMLAQSYVYGPRAYILMSVLLVVLAMVRAIRWRTACLSTPTSEDA